MLSRVIEWRNDKSEFERNQSPMKVVTLCGSMRFYREMQEIAIELETKQGYCVITPIGDAGAPLSDEETESLGKAHYKKIDLADAVYIVNIGGYIGKTVSEELRYAKAHNKEVIFHET